MRYVEESARTIATTATSSKIVVEKSTVPVKAAESISKVLVANQKDGVSFEVRLLFLSSFLGCFEQMDSRIRFQTFYLFIFLNFMITKFYRELLK